MGLQGMLNFRKSVEKLTELLDARAKVGNIETVVGRRKYRPHGRSGFIEAYTKPPV